MRRKRDLAKVICSLAVALASFNLACGQNPELVNDGPEHEKRMEWWRDARFGLFIHWGLYSLPGGIWKGETARKDYAEWVMHNFQIPLAEYRQLAKEFNPTRFDPDAWARLAKEAGMGYFVLTTKHHDGFAMFDSQVSDYNIVDATPFGRDVFAELAAAFRKQGLRVGAYYSQDLDWSQPQGSPIESYNLWDFPTEETNDPVFDRYFEGKSLPQVEELLTRYGDIGVFWFDFPRMMDSERGQRLQDLVRRYQPDAIINGRICNPQGLHADYLVPGDNGYFTSPQPADWECCATMDESWGYKIHAHTKRSADELIVQLATTVSAGGNLLLNIGPKPDGTIPQRQVEILKEIGVWMKDNREAIHGNRANPFGEYFPWGVCTVNSPHLYLHVTHWQDGQTVHLPRLRNRVESVELLGDARRKLDWRQNGNQLEIQLAGGSIHRSASVLKVTTTGNTLDITPVVLEETGGTALLESRYAQSLASRLRVMRHHSVDGVVVCNVSEGHPSEHLQWNVKLAQPGTFELSAEFHQVEQPPVARRTLTVSTSADVALSANVSESSIQDGQQSLGILAIGQAGNTSISLQVKGGGRNSPLYLKSLRLVRLSRDGWKSLFNGENLDGWEYRGSDTEAPTFTVENGTIVGRTLIPRCETGFICTTEQFKDFELVFEMKVDKNLNSGVQIRSTPAGTVRGAQVEVQNDLPKTGFIFGQGMRQWLSSDLPENPSPHFKNDQWNHFRVLVQGQNIKTWINGHPFADTTHDLIALKGVIGLQVHAFPRGKWREAGSDEVLSASWRAIKIREIE